MSAFLHADQESFIKPITTPDGSETSEEQGIIVDRDTDLLEHIGYKQVGKAWNILKPGDKADGKKEFRREFTRWSTLSYAASVMGVLGSVTATWASPLSAGGPATAVWCWFSGSFFSLCIALSISELISAYPTAGGVYFVTKHVFPPKHVPVASWVIGWSNFLGQTAGVASVAYSVGQMLLAAASMSSAQEDGTFLYAPTAEHTVVASIGVLICHGIVCSFPSKTLHRIVRWFTPIGVAGAVAISIALLVLTEDTHSASYVFGTVEDGSGWNSKGFSFLIGYLSVAWTMTDYDATAHLSEELHNAAISGPVAIFEAVLITWIFGWMLNVAYGFCAGDILETLATPCGNPAAQVYYNAGGKDGGLAMWFWAVLVQFFTGISAMLADTRTCFALARDGMFPGSTTLCQMNKHTQTPLYSVWAVVVFCCLLNLIGLGSTQTINGIFGVTAPAMDFSYIAVIGARLWYEKEHPITPGPFRLGRWQKPINLIAIVWVIFISVVLFFPPVYPVTPLNMNYAIAIAGFILMFALSWWCIHARKHYTGPRNEEH